MSKSSKKETKKKSNGEKISKKETGHASCVYDFTLYDLFKVRQIRDMLNVFCKKYTFQSEKGEKKGLFHFQGRFSLKIKNRKTGVIKLLRKIWEGFRVSVTSGANKDNDFYVLKEDTRIEGPFTDQNDVFIPRHVTEMINLYPYQKSIIDMLKPYDARSIDVIINPIGNVGKSSLCDYMCIHLNAAELLYCKEYKDVMRMAYDLGPHPIYLTDLPRALNKKKLADFFQGIETLKSGKCFDDRNTFRMRRMDRPRICIFTNDIPDLTLLSGDMWKLWTVEDNELIAYVDEKAEVQPPEDPLDNPQFLPDE